MDSSGILAKSTPQPNLIEYKLSLSFLQELFTGYNEELNLGHMVLSSLCSELLYSTISI